MQSLWSLLGIDQRHAPWRERLLSGLGGLIGILAILFISRAAVGEGAGLIVASMGASAVLLFAVPHGPLSQPWQLVAGHLISAVIGITCAQWVHDPFIAGPLAVGLAISAMRILRCIHPPGGATALSAVIGGPQVLALGYDYLLTPVLLNVAVILTVAVLFNYPFVWRRYPAALHTIKSGETVPVTPPTVSHADLVYALSEMDTFMDVSEQDLIRIYDLATRHSQESKVLPQSIEPGQFYSNGRYGSDWQVREVLAVEPAGSEGRQVVSFRVIAGHGRRQTGKCGLLEFTRWAGYAVERNENSWQRVNGETPSLG